MDQTLFPLSFTGTIAIVLGAVLPAIAVILLPGRRRARNRNEIRGNAFVAGLAGGLVMVIMVNVLEDASLDLNPVVSDHQLTGTWRHRGATLTLMPDGKYQCAPAEDCAGIPAQGAWARQGDFDVAFLAPDGAERVYRVVRFRGAYHLTYMPNIDLWKRELTFKHAGAAS